MAILHLLRTGSNSEKLIEYELADGLKLTTHLSKRNRTVLLTIYEILIRKIYPIDSLNLRTVIDLGAQIGVFSLYVARKRQSKIYAFEPDPENFKALEVNIERNGLHQCILPQRICLAGNRGTAKFYINESSSRSGGRFKDGHKFDKTIEVQTYTLSEVVSEISETEIDLMKVDIEGSEYEVLYSSPPKLLQKIKRIYVECHEVENSPPTYNLQHMKSFLEELGYHVEIAKGESILYATR